jgi:large subunit ribosomal protein L1
MSITAFLSRSLHRVRVAAFCQGEDAVAAKEAGADLVGVDEIIDAILKGTIAFDRCIATPEVMPKLGKVARVLGPRGLMPNPKLGTVTKDVAKMVGELKGGMVQFRTEKAGIVHAGIGKATFSHTALEENVRAFMVALAALKPEAVKGAYFKAAHLTSTMGKGYKLDTANIDPGNSRFMLREY